MTMVLIESDWNLKGPEALFRAWQVHRINRIRLEFKVQEQRRSVA